MIRVDSHSTPYKVANPAVRGQWNTLVNVVFIEEGRTGANAKLQGSAGFLDSLVGEPTGLNQVRTHTQPVLADTIKNFPVGKEFPGHINRALYSFPQIENQVDKAPRMIDGKPTYFVTDLASQPKEDVDYRLPLEVAATIRPRDFTDAIIRSADIVRLDKKGNKITATTEMDHDEEEQGTEQSSPATTRSRRR